MSVRRIRNWWWVDFRFDFTRYRKRCPSNNRADALAYEALLRQRLAFGQPLLGSVVVEPPKPTFTEVCERWLAWSAVNHKPSNRDGMRVLVRNALQPFFGHLRMNEISGETIERFKAAELHRGLSPNTVNDKLGVLRQCLDLAREEGHIEKVPKFKRLRPVPPRFDVLSREETERLLSDRSDLVVARLVFMAVYTGMRIGELLALSWEDINLERREIIVRRSKTHGITGPTKSYRERCIPIIDCLLEMLVSMESRSGAVFVDEKNKPVSYHDACLHLKALCARLGMRNVRWHALRHTFASSLVMLGASVPAIQQLLGHAQITTTMRYAHVNDLALRDAVKTLETVSGVAAV